MSRKLRRKIKLGATGKFPQGKFNAHDEGALNVAVGVDPKTKKVIIDFGKPVAWIGMESKDAMRFAAFIRGRALEAGAGDTGCVRASGDVLCEECGDTYYHHPSDMKQLDSEGRPFLRVACDGTRLKL